MFQHIIAFDKMSLAPSKKMLFGIFVGAGFGALVGIVVEYTMVKFLNKQEWALPVAGGAVGGVIGGVVGPEAIPITKYLPSFLTNMAQ